MTTRIFKSNVEYAMAIVGVLMIAMVAKLADAEDSGQRESPRPVRRFLARQAIRAVGMIGSAVDACLPTKGEANTTAYIPRRNHFLRT